MGVDDDLTVPGDREFRFRIGLRPVEVTDWLDVDARRGDELRAKARLVADRHGEVVAVTAGSEQPSAEVLHAVVADLVGRRLVEVEGTLIRDVGTGIVFQPDGLHPIDAAGRMVQEDLCVMVPGPDGHVLAAASVCFPGRWRLADKIGRPMGQIHAPVPRYGTDVASGTDRVLGRMAPGRIVERFNWSVIDDASLFQPGGHGETGNRGIDPGRIATDVVLRTERQTLRGLGGGAVVFGIRTRVRPLGELVDRPEFCGELADSLKRLPDEVVAYKSLGSMGEAVIAWLEAAAGR